MTANLDIQHASSQAKPKLALMLAEQYSGATLLAILLDRHSRVSCDGETFPYHARRSVQCTCGVSQIDCEYYRRVCAHMLDSEGVAWNPELFRRSPRYTGRGMVQREVTRFSRFAALSAARDAAVRAVPSWRNAEETFLDAHERYIRESLAYKGASVYVDGTKDFRRAALLAASGRFDVSILHLVREPLGYCNSYIRVRELSRAGLREAAEQWIGGLKRFDAFCARFPETPVETVRYEDLCRDSERTLGRVAEFLGVEHEPNLVSKVITHHILGNRMRFRFARELRESTAWKSELSTDEQAMLAQLLDGGRRRFGYVG